MRTRAFILEGDTTTTGGMVQPQPSIISVGSPPKYPCFEGDPVYCPICQSMGMTKCVPPFLPWTGPDGRQVNLEGDLCICRCPKPPRLVAHGDDMKMYVDGHEMDHLESTDAEAADTESQPKRGQFDRHFVVFDIGTGAPVTGFCYGLKTSIGEHHGNVDADGATISSCADEPLELELSYLVQTEIGVRP